MLLAVRFDNSDILSKLVDELRRNFDKPSVKILFNVEVHLLVFKTLILIKDFIPEKTLNLIYFILLLGTGALYVLWGLYQPLIIISAFMLAWRFLNSRYFNYFLLRIMVRRLDYRGDVRLL